MLFRLELRVTPQTTDWHIAQVLIAFARDRMMDSPSPTANFGTNGPIYDLDGTTSLGSWEVIA